MNSIRPLADLPITNTKDPREELIALAGLENIVKAENLAAEVNVPWELTNFELLNSDQKWAFYYLLQRLSQSDAIYARLMRVLLQGPHRDYGSILYQRILDQDIWSPNYVIAVLRYHFAHLDWQSIQQVLDSRKKISDRIGHEVQLVDRCKVLAKMGSDCAYATPESLPILIITLNPSTSVRASAMDAFLRAQLGIHHHKFIEGVDGRLVEHSEFQGISINKHLRYGELGCLLSHVKCWREVVDRQLPMALILEDDGYPLVNFPQEMLDRFDASEAGILFVNSRKKPGPLVDTIPGNREAFKKGISFHRLNIAEPGRGTDGYLIKPFAAFALLNYFDKVGATTDADILVSGVGMLDAVTKQATTLYTRLFRFLIGKNPSLPSIKSFVAYPQIVDHRDYGISVRSHVDNR